MDATKTSTTRTHSLCIDTGKEEAPASPLSADNLMSRVHSLPVAKLLVGRIIPGQNASAIDARVHRHTHKAVQCHCLGISSAVIKF